MNRVICRVILLLVTLVCCVAQLTPAWAQSVEDSYGRARKAYFDLLDSPRKQKYRDQWLKVRDLFLQTEALDPGHQRSADALYMAGKVSQGLYEISFLKDDLRQAISYFDRLAMQHPGSSLADDGLHISAEIYEQKLGDKQRAIEHYRRLVSIYHDGDMYDSARSRLQELAPGELPPPPAPQPVADASVDAGITGIRYHTYPEFTRVVFDLSKNANAKPGFVKGDAPRIFIDLDPLQAGSSSEPIVLADGRVRQVRVGQYRDDVARVVLDLEQAYPYKVFTLNEPFRVIVDVSGPLSATSVTQVAAVAPPQEAPRQISAGSGGVPGANVAAQAATTAPTQPVAGAAGGAAQTGATAADTVKLDDSQLAEVLTSQPEPEATRVQVPETSRAKKIRVVLDPGHGGKDPGAIGPRGVMEKDVTLALGMELKQQLEGKYPCEVVLTRDRDVYIPLDERTILANELKADLFISLHANANRNRKPYGTETYYLNFSKNDNVLEVVARENGTSLQQVGDLDMILLDLLANSKINESSRLAAEIQDSLVNGLSRKYSDIKDLGVRQGPFHVLWNATMPSVLVEVAFISNKREEKRLADRTFQKHSAEAIAKGVGRYLEAYNLASN